MIKDPTCLRRERARLISRTERPLELGEKYAALNFQRYENLIQIE